MAPLPVIADVFRVAFPFNGDQGVAPTNVLNVRTTGNAAHVGAAIDGAIAFMLGAGNNPWEPLVSAQVCDHLEIIALDGVSGVISYPLANHITGSASGEQEPAVAALIKESTGVRGPAHRGRVFVGPVREGVAADGILGGAVVTQLTAAWNLFQTALAAASPVVTIVVASYVHHTADDVLSFTCSPVLATLRRRQNQLR
jgi:hypothetical protein